MSQNPLPPNPLKNIQPDKTEFNFSSSTLDQIPQVQSLNEHAAKYLIARDVNYTRRKIVERVLMYLPVILISLSKLVENVQNAKIIG